jgi:hypothetical protein
MTSVLKDNSANRNSKKNWVYFGFQGLQQHFFDQAFDVDQSCVHLWTFPDRFVAVLSLQQQILKTDQKD